LSLIRKVFWPAAIALGFLVFLGAIGGPVPGASADDSDFCAIEGPDVIAVDDTVLYIGRLERGELDDDDDYTASVDNIVGNSKITSFLDGDDLDDYETINPTNIVHDLDGQPIFGLDEELNDFLAEEFDQFDADDDGLVLELDNAECDETLSSHLREMILEAIDRGEACTAFVTATTSGGCVQTRTFTPGTTTTATNPGGGEIYGDFDIDCPTQTSCAIATAIITAAVNALVREIQAGEDDCDDLSDEVERAVLDAGAAEIIGAQFNDYIEDVCELRFEEFLGSAVIVDVTCLVAGNFDISFADEDDSNDVISKHVVCLGEPSADSTLTATPTSVEIVPALGNVSHSLILLTALDEEGEQAGPGHEVDFTTDRCSIETSGVDTAAEITAARSQSTGFRALNGAVPATAAAVEAHAASVSPVDSSRTVDSTVTVQVGEDTFAAAILGCNPGDAPGATPGVATITAIIQVEGQDIVETVRVTVIGPPFSMTISASPSTLRCGEKSTIQVSVKDAIGQNVSDHTRIEAVTNAGGVLGGTGAVQGLAGPVVPISSTVGETFDGVATFYLLTSEQHSGPYEVVVTTGGAGSVTTGLGGVFSTRPVVIQTTVTCTLPQAAAPAPAPTITAPRTGQGITPPNTGDGGLADNSASWALFAVVGMVAFAVAGAATLKFARR
jgi:hypothetical protein